MVLLLIKLTTSNKNTKWTHNFIFGNTIKIKEKTASLFD